jgi:ADP-heptose:LPS heptosyltransferase
MKNTLICKLGATGDVVRTTALLREIAGDVTWITDEKNTPLLRGLSHSLRVLNWDERDRALDRSYDLVINLEDSVDVGAFAKDVRAGRRFGALLNGSEVLGYTEDSRQWFDLSLISAFGRQKADQLKLENRRSYQDLLFDCLDLQFSGQKYLLPSFPETDLTGDVAIAAEAGPVWPMKKWAYYDELKERLESEGLKVNFLKKRPTLLEHLGDVAGHRCLVGGDSLPMHFALGAGVRCVSIFTCTSPWEIHDYGILTKIISPRLAEFFYQRGLNREATTAIGVDEVFEAVMAQVRSNDLRPSFK